MPKEHSTLPALLKRNAERYGDSRVAIREKEFGIWQSVTWKGYYENVRDFALGLHELGFKPGNNLSYAGDNRPQGLYAELAAQALGGAIVGIYPDSHLEQVAYIINHSDSIFLVAGDQEQADKVLELKSTCPKVKKVIVDDPKGMRHYDDPILAYFKDIQKLGRQLADQRPHLFDEMIAAVSPDDVGMINYTSGTTGLPKGSMITQQNMVAVARLQDAVDSAEDDFEYVSFLPFAWIGEQEFGVYWPLYKAFAVNFPEKVETVQENIREIGPHILLAPPRVWEKMCSEIQVKIQGFGHADHILVGDHAAFRESCGARGVIDHAHIVGRDLGHHLLKKPGFFFGQLPAHFLNVFEKDQEGIIIVPHTLGIIDNHLFQFGALFLDVKDLICLLLVTGNHEGGI